VKSATIGELHPFIFLITGLVSTWVPHVMLLPMQEKDPVPDPFVYYMPSFVILPLSFCRRDHSLGEDHLPANLSGS
jgi:hypothetical protein